MEVIFVGKIGIISSFINDGIDRHVQVAKRGFLAHSPANHVQDITGQRNMLRQELEIVKNEKKTSAALVKASKAALKSEKAADTNSRRYGQPVQAAIEQIMKKHGIDKAAFHGGDLQGPSCRTLMIKRKKILNDVWHASQWDRNWSRMESSRRCWIPTKDCLGISMPSSQSARRSAIT